MPIDPFAATIDGLGAPARAPYAIAPSDSVALPVLPKAIYVGNGGHMVLRGVDASADVTLRNLAAGQVIDVRASHVRATGTTATDLVALV